MAPASKSATAATLASAPRSEMGRRPGRLKACPAIGAATRLLARVFGDLDAAVLRASLLRRVARDRVLLPKALRRDAARLDALLDHVVLRRVGAPLGELEVVGLGSDRVGVPLDECLDARIRLHLADDLVDLLLAGGLEGGLVEVEERIRLERDLLVHRRRGRWRRRRGRRRRFLLGIADRVAEERADQAAAHDAAGDRAAPLPVGRVVRHVVHGDAAGDTADRRPDDAARDRTGAPLPVPEGAAGRERYDQQPHHEGVHLTHTPTSIAVREKGWLGVTQSRKLVNDLRWLPPIDSRAGAPEYSPGGGTAC